MTMISDSAMLSELAAEFPGYEFSTQRTWEGVSLIAVRQKGSARSGLYVVITPDFDEMRRTLLDSTGLDRPGRSRAGGGSKRGRWVDVPLGRQEHDQRHIDPVLHPSAAAWQVGSGGRGSGWGRTGTMSKGPEPRVAARRGREHSARRRWRS
jgi:hypothetical protein